jgi:DNA polymerase-3 subunit delta'
VVTDDATDTAATPRPWVDALPWQNDWLARALSGRDRLPAALLVTGRAGIGKFVLARNLARGLLCEAPRADGLACGACDGCRYVVAGNHPDHRILDPIGWDEKKGEFVPVNEIQVDRVRRDVVDFLAVSSHRGGRRVVVVSPAGRMNMAAANALLKTLEEPPAGATLVLVAGSPGRIPATVASRCMRMPAPRPDPAEAASWLAAQGVDLPDEVLALAGGAPLAALELARDGQGGERDAWFDALARPDALDPVALGARIDLAGKDERRSRVAAAVDAIEAFTADLARVAAGGRAERLPRRAAALDALAGRVAAVDLCRYHREVLLQRARLARPLAPRLVIESLAAGYRALWTS